MKRGRPRTSAAAGDLVRPSLRARDLVLVHASPRSTPISSRAARWPGRCQTPMRVRGPTRPERTIDVTVSRKRHPAPRHLAYFARVHAEADPSGRLPAGAEDNRGHRFFLQPLRHTKTLYRDPHHGEGYHNLYGEKDRSAYRSEQFADAHLTPLGWDRVRRAPVPPRERHHARR